MPPVNTPRTRSPEPISETSTRPITPLSYLSSPAPDLAATLVSQTEANAEDENVRFLRTPIEELEAIEAATRNASVSDHTAEWRRRRQQRLQAARADRVNSPINTASTATTETPSNRGPQQRERMLRVLSRLSRFQETGRTTHPRLEDDWSRYYSTSADTPASEGDRTVGNIHSEVAELRYVLDELRRENLYLTRDSYENSSTPQTEEHRTSADLSEEQRNDIRTTRQIIDSLRQAERDLQALERRLDVTSRRVDTPERNAAESLRSTAIMQHARTNASTTERMLRYIRDRERLGNGTESEEQPREPIRESTLMSRWVRLNRGTGFTVTDADTAMAENNSPLLESTSNTVTGEPDASELASRSTRDVTTSRLISRRTKAVQSPVSPFLENTIIYMDRLRECDTFDEALELAIELGFDNKEFFADKHDDFLLDLWSFPAPIFCSWLQPGARFTGRQHTTYRTNTAQPLTRPAVPPRVPDLRRAPPLQSTEVSDLRASQPLEQWPVKLTIHTVDLEAMTLSGTMEAHDLPTKDPDDTAPITTFLEGQIIDLRTHTFLTPKTGNIAFPTTSAANDAANWRRLPPFIDTKDDTEVARIFLSEEHLRSINKEYIFMRWKERCFIHGPSDECPASPAARRARSVPALGEGDDTDKGHGLTICGFYYVSLNRSTGQVMGLYCDPNTSPYQCLMLDGVDGGSRGAWAWK